MVKAMRRAFLCGAFVLGLGAGCGLDSSVGNDITSITGSDVAAEQLALPDADGGGADDRAGRCERSELARLTSLLGLSADQITQVQAILDNTRAALKDIRAQVQAGTLSREDAHTQVKALHEAERTQILSTLTAEQQATFSTLRDHHDGPFDLDRLGALLGLTAEQTALVTTITGETQSKINDIHAQVEAGTLSREDAHTQTDQVLRASIESIKALLTAEQQAKLAAVLARGRGPGHGPGRGGHP